MTRHTKPKHLQNMNHKITININDTITMEITTEGAKTK